MNNRVLELIFRLYLFLIMLTPGLLSFNGLRAIAVIFIFLGLCLSFVAVVAFLGGRRIVAKKNTVRTKLNVRYVYFFGIGFFIFQVVSVVRGVLSSYDVIQGSSVNFFLVCVNGLLGVVLAFALSENKFPNFRIFHWVMQSLGLVSLINLTLFLAGISNPSAEDNLAAAEHGLLLSYVGFHIQRVFFALSSGVNTYGISSGLLLTYGLVYLYTKGRDVWFLPGIKKNKLEFILLCIVPLLSLLLTDSRGAILAVFFSYMVILVSPRFRALVASCVMLLFFCFFMVSLEGVSESTSSLFTRDSSASSVFSGRENIWIVVVEEMMKPKAIHLYGYGLYGHTESGVSSLYSDNFLGWGGTTDLIGVHSALLQVFLDSGFLGLFFTVGLFIAFIALMHRANSIEPIRGDAAILTSIMVFLFIQGMSEATLSPYSANSFLVLGFAYMYMCRLNYTWVKKGGGINVHLKF